MLKLIIQQNKRNKSKQTKQTNEPSKHNFVFISFQFNSSRIDIIFYSNSFMLHLLRRQQITFLSLRHRDHFGTVHTLQLSILLLRSIPPLFFFYYYFLFICFKRFNSKKKNKYTHKAQTIVVHIKNQQQIKQINNPKNSKKKGNFKHTQVHFGTMHQKPKCGVFDLKSFQS